jgi:hypothetical protein
MITKSGQSSVGGHEAGFGTEFGDACGFVLAGIELTTELGPMRTCGLDADVKPSEYVKYTMMSFVA